MSILSSKNLLEGFCFLWCMGSRFFRCHEFIYVNKLELNHILQRKRFFFLSFLLKVDL